LAASLGIDLLSFSILSNHFHFILRSRPDVVATWTARRVVPGKHETTSESTPSIFERLSLQPNTWFPPIAKFGKLFNHVAGRRKVIDDTQTVILTMNRTRR